jgi:ATP-dependent Clp protease adaptor protein ClpS
MKNVLLLEMSREKLEKKSLSKRGTWVVVLHDDNHNTFEHVTNCLMDFCGHTYLQAGQIALIVHEVGKCIAMHDNYETCVSVHRDLLKQGLKVMIEKQNAKKNN